MNPQKSSRASYTIYPGPQNAPDVSAGMNVLGFPEGPRPKATDLSAGAQAGVSPWYGVYLYNHLTGRLRVIPSGDYMKFWVGRRSQEVQEDVPRRLRPISAPSARGDLPGMHPSPHP